jgi:DNA mismatch endonuclease (patch repair protein)
MTLPAHPGSSEVHSRRMARMPRHATQPELVVRGMLRSMSLHFRQNVKDLPGKPDLASKKHRFAIFVHGCFWHGHVGCAQAKVPTSNRWWWREKIEDNRNRDDGKEAALKALGFRVLTIWACELKQPLKVGRKLRAATRHLR